MSCKNKYLPSACLILLLGPPLSPASFADENNRTYCQVEKLTAGWQLLNAQCDIGNGLWGRRPKPSNSSFWIQCNYGKSLPNKAMTKTIRGLFPGNSYLVPDNENYRCLIGPFQGYNQAQTARAQLTENQLEQTFIRQTASPVAISSKAVSHSTAPAPTTASSIPQNNQQPTPKIANRVVLNSIIYSFTFNNLNYHQPRTINSTADMPPAFIREHDQYWSKVNFLPAESWCKRYGLRLPTITELKALQTYGQYLLLRHQWPIKSSYWSSTINPYTGEIKTLNLRSGQPDEYRPLAQLYTTCVSDAA